MSRTCPHCGFPIEEKYDFCAACEWMHLGISPEVEMKTVAAAQFVLAAYQQHYVVRTIDEVHQLMVDLMVGCEDELTMEAVGLLRKILEVAVDKELESRVVGSAGVMA